MESSHSPLNLLELLPAELVNEIIRQIYSEHLLVKLHTNNNNVSYDSPLRNRKLIADEIGLQLIAPLLANKRIGAEAAQALYRNVTFFFCGLKPGLKRTQAFLDSVGLANLANIRSIEVCFSGGHRHRLAMRGIVGQLAVQLPHLTRLRVHIIPGSEGADSPYKTALRMFCAQRHLKDLSMVLHRRWEAKALHWTSKYVFTGSEIYSMIENGYRKLAKLSDQMYLRVDDAVLCRAVALHASESSTSGKRCWMRTDEAGEVVEYHELNMEQPLSSKLASESTQRNTACQDGKVSKDFAANGVTSV
nr:hypothetical protein B0A51_02866 [Rachicladosporium sp. CCFEE 5018]